MLVVLQICIEVNSGSVGRIAEQIGQKAIENNWESYITFARKNLPSKSNTIKIGSKLSVYWHGFLTRIFDNQGFASKKATKQLIKKIDEINPDIIHLHHLHGYYINIEILFNYLSKINKPIVWTFHDCWSFTGHCAHFDFVGCDKWKTACFNCEQKSEYPKSIFLDRSRKNFIEKKQLFNSIKNLTIVPVSYWLGDLVKQSFLKDHSLHVIQNGIDTDVFTPRYGLEDLKSRHSVKDKFVILGVASTWGTRKGLNYFFELREKLNDDYKIILVGLNKQSVKNLPEGIVGIERTESVNELAQLYSLADVFVNPTLEDTFPTTNLEALACGTPVITFATGGSVESVDENTGYIVPKGDLRSLINSIEKIRNIGKSRFTESCRQKAVKLYNKNLKFEEYFKLYSNLLEKKSN